MLLINNNHFRFQLASDTDIQRWLKNLYSIWLTTSIPTVQNNRIILFSTVVKFCCKYITLGCLLQLCLSASEKIAVVYNDYLHDNAFNIFERMFSMIDGLEKYQYLIIGQHTPDSDTRNSMKQYKG